MLEAEISEQKDEIRNLFKTEDSIGIYNRKIMCVNFEDS